MSDELAPAPAAEKDSVAAALEASRAKDWAGSIAGWNVVLDKMGDAAPAAAYKHLAIAYRQRRELDAAEAILRKGRGVYAKDDGILVEFAELAMVRRDWNEAIRLWSKVAKGAKPASRTHDRAMLGLHLSYAAIGDFDQSIEAFLKVEGADQSKLPDFTDPRARRIFNLLTYTKTSGSRYAARRAPGGYQTLRVSGQTFSGSRNPEARFAVVPIDFTGKSVLDLGSNQGAMLFHLADKIKFGVGLDYDPKMVNAANGIRQNEGYHHLNFYNFDLDQEAVDLIPNFLPDGHVDCVLLFRVLGWLSKPTETLRIIAQMSKTMVFQNHVDRPANLAMVRRYFSNVQECTDHSQDSNIRDIYVCTNE